MAMRAGSLPSDAPSGSIRFVSTGHRPRLRLLRPSGSGTAYVSGGNSAAKAWRGTDFLPAPSAACCVASGMNRHKVSTGQNPATAEGERHLLAPASLSPSWQQQRHSSVADIS
eukprot:2192665-Rhodomonas_salina.3